MSAWPSPLAELLHGVRSPGVCNGCLPGLIAVALFVPLNPLTHALGGRLLFGKASWSAKSTFLRGGTGFLALQTLSWTFWAFAVVAALAGGAAAHRDGVHHLTPVLSRAAVSGCLLAEVLLVASLLTFQVRPPASNTETKLHNLWYCTARVRLWQAGVATHSVSGVRNDCRCRSDSPP